MDRRGFLTAVAGAAAWPHATLPLRGAAPARILVLGGTNFVGPAIVNEARARGHDVTLFNRGITRPWLFDGLEHLRGERGVESSDLAALAGDRRWDAVIDVWPEHRELVRQTATLLHDRVDYYFFVSSIAAYADFSRPGIDESAAVRTGPAGSYGAEKAAAEAVLRELFTGRHGVARCHAIVGPLDPGVSYHFWLRRLARTEEVLCPGSGSDPVQVIDVRDLGRWAIDSVEARRNGTYNLTGPWPPRTMRALLSETAAALGSEARLTWVDADFLRRDHGVASFSDMPLWAPLDEDEGFYQIDGSAALRDGAVFRPVSDTAVAAWRWYRSAFFKDTWFPHQGQGIGAEREREILAAWHEATQRGPESQRR